MSKRILLVVPRNDRAFSGNVRNGKCGMANLSLTTVASRVPDDWEVVYHDARVSEVDFDSDVDVVGITAMTVQATDAYRIADGFAEKGTPVLMGGMHPTALPDEALEHADAVVAGEGEHVIETALRDLEKGQMKGVYRAETLCEMKNMPTPRRDLLDRDMYVTGYYTIQATRGCPYDCKYCAVTGVFGREFRMRPVEEVVDEISTFDGRHFFFVDDNICGKPAYAKELFSKLIPLRKTWGGQTSINFADDEELLDLYARSGGKYAFIGLETISEEGLKNLNKSWSKFGQYKEWIRKIHKAGINVLGSFIVGLDTDDSGVFDRMLKFCDEAGVDAAQFHILTPLPGTRLFEEMESTGRLLHRDWEKFHTGECVIQPANMTAEELEAGFYRLNREFYSIPRVLRRTFSRPRGILCRASMNLGYRNRALRMPQNQ